MDLSSVRGEPVQVLVEAGRDAGLLVVGTSPDAAGLAHTSVSRAVLLHATCPVAVVHD